MSDEREALVKAADAACLLHSEAARAALRADEAYVKADGDFNEAVAALNDYDFGAGLL